MGQLGLRFIAKQFDCVILFLFSPFLQLFIKILKFMCRLRAMSFGEMMLSSNVRFPALWETWWKFSAGLTTQTRSTLPIVLCLVNTCRFLGHTLFTTNHDTTTLQSSNYYFWREQNNAISPNFVLAVVFQEFNANVDTENYVIKGNDVLLKCDIPSFVTDLVQITGWIDSSENEYLPKNGGNLQNIILRCLAMLPSQTPPKL